MAGPAQDSPGRIAREARPVLQEALGDDPALMQIWATDAGLPDTWLQSVDWTGSVVDVTARVARALSRCAGPQVARYLQRAADDAYAQTQQRLCLLAERAARLPDVPMLDDAIPEQATLGGAMRSQTRLVASVLMAAVTLGLLGMGLVVHLRRVGMLGLQWDQLAWRPDQAFVSGVMALFAQILYFPLSLLAWGERPIALSALALVALAVGVVLAGRRLSLRTLLRLQIVLLPLLFLGAVTAGRVVTHPAIRAPASQVDRSASVHFSSRFPAAAVATAATWLENDRDDQRRALAGISGGFLLVLGAGMVSLFRREQESRRERRQVALAVGGHLILVAYVLLSNVPAAYAYAHWGISYPRVASIESCAERWTTALEDPACAAWDVSGGSADRLYYAASDCPSGPWWRLDPGCRVVLGEQGVVQRKVLLAP